MSCEGCGGIDRREFLERSLAMISLSALAACGVSDMTAPGTTQFTVTLSNYPVLGTVGGRAVVSSGNAPIAVARTGTDSFVALSLVCPHRGVTVDISGSGFFCPGHGAVFAADGAWTGGQGTSSLSRYPCVYDANAGTLLIG